MDTALARQMHDDLLAHQPEGARHDADICQFCADNAAKNTSTVPDPSRLVGDPDVSETNPQAPNEHGGRDTNSMSDTISTETHEALVKTKVADAVAATEQALATKTEEAATEKARADAAEAELTTVKADNARLNGELDTAQLSLKAAEDKAAQLEADIAKKNDEARVAELASSRAEQVKALGLYDETYVAERAGHWASLSDEDWASRLEEWAKVRPATTETAKAGSTTDTASALSGSTGELTKDPQSDAAAETQKPKARRAVLGLS